MAETQKPELPAAGTTDWQALAAKLSALGSIAGAAAHRFNNLRAVIEGTLELLAAEPAVPRLAPRLERIKEAAAHAQVLAQGLVAVARCQQGSEDRIDLAAWLSAAEPWLSDLLGEGRGLRIEVPATPVPFFCDPAQLRPALTAMVLNAAASLGPAGTVHIRIQSAPPEGRAAVLLQVTDDGAGMPPQVAARAREPFFTTRAGAAGLGLTVVEAFATHHGGRLELASSPGRGTVVSLFLAEAGGAVAS